VVEYSDFRLQIIEDLNYSDRRIHLWYIMRWGKGGRLISRIL
jgi:hypothetical protein